MCKISQFGPGRVLSLRGHRMSVFEFFRKVVGKLLGFLGKLMGSRRDFVGKLRGSNTRGVVKLPSAFANIKNQNLSHLYYWEGFTIVVSSW